MGKTVTRAQKKESYDRKFCGLLEKYDKAFIVHADNVGSKQFQNIRIALRNSGDTTVLMGKNTMMKRCLRLYIDRTGNDKWEGLMDVLVGNVGIVFTMEALTDVRDKINEFRVGAPARAGVIAPCSVSVSAGPTGMDPSQTSFFQTLNIATKINKGTVEILNDMVVVTEGDKVGASQATLLAKLGIRPFTYGLRLMHVFEGGAMFSPKVLNISNEDINRAIMAGVQNVAALSLATGVPTLAAVPHSIINAFKNVLSVGLQTEYSFPLCDKIKDMLANPGAFASAAPAASGGAAAAKAKAPEPEPEEEEEDMGFDLFD